MTADVTTPRVNVLDPEFYVDPWDAYRWLREEAPVFWDPVQKLWAISRYDDIIAIEVDGARVLVVRGSRPHLDQREDRSIINMDDPAHQTATEPRRAPVHAGSGPQPRGARARHRPARSSTTSRRAASAKRSRPSRRACPRS